MKETLALLVELQGIEDRLRGLREMGSRLDSIRKENQQSLTVFAQLLSENEEQLTEIEDFCKTTEADIERSAEDARRSRQRMSAITSQKELNALNKEIENARRKNQNATEELKKLREQYATAKGEYDARVTSIDTLKGEMKLIEDKLVSDIEEGKANSQSESDRRTEIVAALDAPIYGRFARVMKSRGGVAVVDVRNEICTGCRMKVPPQQYNRVLVMNTLESCQSCSRILVNFQGLTEPVDDAM